MAASPEGGELKYQSDVSPGRSPSSSKPSPQRAGLPFLLESLAARFRHLVILCAGATADANGANHDAISLEWNSPSKDHDAAIIGCVNAEELPAGL